MSNSGKLAPDYSRVGVWDLSYRGDKPRKMYDDAATAKIAGGFLNQPNILEIEDRGCGYGGFADYIGSHQTYIGVDGSQSKAASINADLVSYVSDVDAVHMRAIIEHNSDWLPILKNAIKSFRKRMVLTLFTPYQETTRLIDTMPNYNGTGHDMIDIGFARDDIVEHFKGLKWFSVENIKTVTKYEIEHMFFLERV